MKQKMLSGGVETPSLVLDYAKLRSNIAGMRSHLAKLGVPLRPHVKTAKSIDVARLALEGQPGSIAVSTLKEADYFYSHGVSDILYAVGIAPNKLAHVIRLVDKGARLALITDNVKAAAACDDAARAAGVTLPLLIELDVDGHRSGIAPDASLLLELAAFVLQHPGIELRGVMTHAGESYNCRSEQELVAMAEQERASTVHAAERLRRAGFDCPVVSVGSTPTATFAEDLSGVTEVRAGVYMFNDLVMAGLGVCHASEIALSVLVSVIGHQPEKGLVITDGGWMALSRDRSIANQSVDQGYGLVCDERGELLAEDMLVVSTFQEHAVIARRDGGAIDPNRFPVGTLFRILPNHACATAAQHSAYHVVDGSDLEVRHIWERLSGC